MGKFNGDNTGSRDRQDQYQGCIWRRFSLDYTDPSPIPKTIEDKGVIKVYYADDKNNDEVLDKYQIKIIFKVVNGSWNNDTAEDIEEIVTLMKDGRPSEDGEYTIEEKMIPGAGEKPATGYKAGNWDMDPVGQRVNGEATYTYTYVPTEETDPTPGEPVVPPTPEPDETPVDNNPPADDDNPVITPAGNPAAPVAPAAVITAVTGAPAAVADAIGDTLQGATATVRELTNAGDEDVPLANTNLENEHKCCIFHFLVMLISMIVLAFFTRSMKKRQKEIFELREELDTELAKRGLPLSNEKQ